MKDSDLEKWEANEMSSTVSQLTALGFQSVTLNGTRQGTRQTPLLEGMKSGSQESKFLEFVRQSNREETVAWRENSRDLQKVSFQYPVEYCLPVRKLPKIRKTTI